MPADDREEAADGLLGGVVGLLLADIAPTQMLVRMAQAGRFPLDQDLELSRGVQVDLFDLPILAPAIKDGCVRFHVDTPCAMTARSRVAYAVCHRSAPEDRPCTLFRAAYFPNGERSGDGSTRIVTPVVFIERTTQQVDGWLRCPEMSEALIVRPHRDVDSRGRT